MRIDCGIKIWRFQKVSWFSYLQENLKRPIQNFHTLQLGLGHASCMQNHHNTCIPAVTWLSTHTQRTTCRRHGIPNTSTASRYPGIQAAYFTTLSSQLKSKTDGSAVVPATTQHNARHCILHIAAMIWYIHCILCNSGICKCNNLRLRYSSGEEKIEDRDRYRDLCDFN